MISKYSQFLSKNKNHKSNLTKKEQASYAAPAFSRSGIYNLMTMFLLVFYTDAVKLKPVTAGAIIVLAAFLMRSTIR